VILPMNEFTRRTMINLDIALEEVCRSLPHGGDHEIRRKIAQKLLDSVMLGTAQRSALTEVARAALAEETKKCQPKDKSRRVAPATFGVTGGCPPSLVSRRSGILVQRKPCDVVRSVAIVAVGRLPERTGELPFLGLVAPLNRSMAKNVV
jgi:hypothetical protein